MIRKYVVKVGKDSYEVEVEEIKKQGAVQASYSNIIMPPVLTNPIATPKPKLPSGVHRQKSTEGKTINAMMSGSILAILVKEGDEVKEGDTVIKLEAMKMETVVASPFTGKVKEILVTERQAVQAGEMLVVVE